MAKFATITLVSVLFVAGISAQETQPAIDADAAIAAFCKGKDTDELKGSVKAMCLGEYTPRLLKDGSRFSNRSHAGKALNSVG